MGGRIPDDSFDYTSACPSYTHMSIAKLVEKGYVKFCMSTNLDCLHVKSGLVALDTLAEAHGNIYVERCKVCEDEVLRPFPIRRQPTTCTGRKCSCGGDFMDSGIDFGQNLPSRHFQLSEEHATRSDFSIVVVSSMRVRPASEMPVMGKRVAADGPRGKSPANLCLVNRQDTPLDGRALIRSYGDADLFFFHVMRELELEVDEPSVCTFKTTSQMRKLAAKLLPPTGWVGPVPAFCNFLARGLLLAGRVYGPETSCHGFWHVRVNYQCPRRTIVQAVVGFSIM